MPSRKHPTTAHSEPFFAGSALIWKKHVKEVGKCAVKQCLESWSTVFELVAIEWDWKVNSMTPKLRTFWKMIL